MPQLRSYDLAVDIGTSTMRATTVASPLYEQRSRCRNTPAMVQGVVADPEAVVTVLKSLVKKLCPSLLARPRVLGCVPTDASASERSVLETCILRAGAARVVIVPEPLAAAVGAGIDIASKYSKLIVDFGEGVTDCALIHKGRVAHSLAVRVGCGDLRRQLRQQTSPLFPTPLSREEADRLLRMIGVAPHGLVPPQLTAIAAAIWDAVEEPVSLMLDTIQTIMSDLPPSFGAEVIEDGIHLTGGGALLPRLCELVEVRTGIHAIVAPEPLASVIHGARAMLPVAATLKLWK